MTFSARIRKVLLSGFILGSTFATLLGNHPAAGNNSITIVKQSNRPATNESTFYGAADKRFRYTGRIDFTNPQLPRFWAPGTYIEAKFTGLFCKIEINDEVLWGNSHNYIDIVIDGARKRIQTTGKSNTIIAAENLADAEHTLLICKDTEAKIGYLEFVGIRCKELKELPPPPSRKIEFIGNSITCGTGSDLSEVACDTKQWYDQHNAYMSYGPVTARKLNAQWHLSSYSGIGLIHSCCNLTINMPEIYSKLYFEKESPEWNVNQYIPDVITICLGQNDGLQDSMKFCNAYVTFIHTLRTYYPKAYIVCITSPMADAVLTKGMKNYLTGIVQKLNSQGDTNVFTFFFSRSYNSGCGGHPDLNEHQLIANELSGFIRKNMNWQ